MWHGDDMVEVRDEIPAVDEFCDLRIAAARVEEARAQYGIARADRLPGLALNASGASLLVFAIFYGLDWIATVPPTVRLAAEAVRDGWSVGGMAKGAGMIHPNMATMLAFLATDFSVPRSFLQKTLSEAVTGTFNCITVDGDMSTNDTVLMLANGHSGVSVGDKSPRELRVLFAEAVWKACEALADKGGLQAAQSMHVQFTTDEMTYRWTYRADGQPLWNTIGCPLPQSL